MASILPYDTFDLPRSAEAARRYSKMENIYHRGQALAWDGRQVLDELCKKHGKPSVREQHRAPLQRVLGSILWGELAAWKIAAQLADELLPLEARMAATSQAHDEARHFYVMHDYMMLALGDFPRGMPRAAERLLGDTLHADTPAKKIIGMQLQLETTALTIFHALRDADVCPVLSDLLVYYEKDEARHVGLGTQLLPTLMKQMTIPERVAFTAFSFKIAAWSLASLKSTEADLEALGISPRRVAILGKSKQMMAFDELWSMVPGGRNRASERLGHVFDAVAEALWPDADARAPAARLKRIWAALREGMETVPTVLDPGAAPVDPQQARREAAN